jgi:cobalt-zinc-cadmium efflux system protein
MAHVHAAEGLDARRAGNRARMRAALAINLALLVATIVGGILADSLALLADAGHLLSDAGAIALALLAARLAARPPTATRTFGLQRTEVLGALVNGIALVVIAVLIVVAAIGRFSDPPNVGGAGVLALGVVGLAGNVAATLVLGAGERGDINLEGALRHSFGDAVNSLGVVVAGVVILTTGWNTIDPLVSVLIAVFIALSSWRLLKEPLDVFMEAAPAGMDVGEIGRSICSQPDVVEVHDLHVWTVTSGFPALSAHVVLSPKADRDLARARIERMLDERFEIHHTTLQMVESAEGGRLIQVEPSEPPR